MPRKIKYNRPELKRHRTSLARYEHYIPMLKLKQKQLQMAITDVQRKYIEVAAAEWAARERFAGFSTLLHDVAGVDIRALAAPDHIRYESINVAGIEVQGLEEIEFPQLEYSLFATAPWTDRVIAELREINKLATEAKVLGEQKRVLSRELQKIIQRVNLFEKVKVPEARDAIRRIRIHLGDTMAASVGRARIAKSKLSDTQSGNDSQSPSEVHEKPQPEVSL